MQHLILETVMKITNQRDVNSLEYCLITVIAELLGLKQVALYRPTHCDGELAPNHLKQDFVELQLDPHQAQFSSVQTPPSYSEVDYDVDVQTCFSAAKTITFCGENQLNRVIIPLLRDYDVIAVAVLISENDLTPWVDTLKCIMQIY
jgi:hypothetical protein